MTENKLEVNWREVPRSEMFGRVISAVDASYGEAQENGDENWAHYCENVLFPFLEAEEEKATVAGLNQLLTEDEMPKGKIPQMSPEEKDALLAGIRRSDALNNAYWVIEENPSPSEEIQQEMLDELGRLGQRASEHVDRMKKIYGFPGY